jgi:hypothetical protein
LDAESSTDVMVDIREGAADTAVKQLRGGADGLIAWLTTMFDRSRWQPSGVVVVGSHHDLDALSWQLEKALPVPVVTQRGVPLALARGAAMASALSTQFADTREVKSTSGDSVARRRQYAGALTVLVGAAATLVASVSLAIGPRLIPKMESGPIEPVVPRSATAAVAQAPASPRAALPTPQAAPETAPTDKPAEKRAVVPPPTDESSAAVLAEPAASRPAAEPPPPGPAAEPVPPPEQHPIALPPPEPRSLLAMLLESLRGQPSDPAPDDQAPAPGLLPNVGAPLP